MRNSRIEFPSCTASFYRITFPQRLLFTIAMIVTAFAANVSFGQMKNAASPFNRRLSGLAKSQNVVGKPYEVTSRFHLMEGTTSGYLVVQVQLAEGSYMYSLSQAGALNPTKIEVVKSDAFFIDGKFNPDRPAEVIENDPVFHQRVEKHKGRVQFFVPVKFNHAGSVGAVQPEIIINGQVCTTEGVCMPIRNKRVKAEFGGFFGRTVEAPRATEATTIR